jgi:hypothetical protein
MSFASVSGCKVGERVLFDIVNAGTSMFLSSGISHGAPTRARRDGTHAAGAVAEAGRAL